MTGSSAVEESGEYISCEEINTRDGKLNLRYSDFGVIILRYIYTTKWKRFATKEHESVLVRSDMSLPIFTPECGRDRMSSISVKYSRM